MAYLLTLATIPITAVVYFALVTYRHRCKIYQLRKQGIPMPKEWSWITGHLLTLQKYQEQLPPDANVNLATKDLCAEFPEAEFFLMDYWPVYPPLFVAFSPEICSQITSKHNLPKTEQIGKSLLPITGGQSMISMNGDEWKFWRGLFNPGFSAASIMDNLPHIVDRVQVFCEKLQEHVSDGIFCLDELTLRLTMDVIIKVTLDANLDYQRSDNALATALGYITRWHSFWDPRILMHPLRPFIQWYYGRVMNTYIRTELQKRFEERTSTATTKASGRNQSAISLALEAYMADQTQKSPPTPTTKLDDHFAQYATNQIRLFLFAGNDTTSSSIVYTYHLLSKNPEAMEKLQKEHDEIFSPDTSKAANLLKEKPALLNQCRYTLAVIKETLRLYAPASTMRAPSAGVVVTDRHNNSYPMDAVGATIVHPAIHTNPRLWPRPLDFLPERFLVDSDHALYPPAAAYRPFEQGPRACIGQTLVYSEMKTVLVMTARTFKISPAYEEWDKMKVGNKGWLDRLGFVKRGPKTVHGDRAYQTDKAGTHPADGYPCRVELLGRQS
ncbi:cytochrome P450 [Byssothecium circinans]|uniref:Cytochrome P450 n=1 Tax=Byssothecium circinans TaxID=147558 RepID=A0A6A5TXA6_9PLEO|nr:cytochrome P450 [Byssothecium circinans]